MQRKLSVINIATMYLGAILGAGFASGRECWQFFGVFGKLGYFGAAFTTVVFVVLALMLTYIARSKGTADLGKLVSPVDNPKLESAIGYVLAAIYYTLIISMSAAGGSLLHQELGLDRRIGGILIVLLVLVTVFGDFERLSRAFGVIIPFVFLLGISTILLVLFSGKFTQSGVTSGFKPSEMAPYWWIAGVIFAAYNSLGFITMAGGCALSAKDSKTAYRGAFLGAFLPGVMTLLLLTALLKDMAFSATLDLPMLGYSLRISKVLNVLYAVILYGSIYSTASSTFYGFSTKLPENRWKKPVMVVAAFLGFGIGLSGFKKMVAYLYPPQGYIGIVIIGMIIVNFFHERKKNSQKQHIQAKV